MTAAPFLIGLAGGSCSGKGHISQALAESLGEDVLVLALDDYYRDRADLSLQERAGLNYDEPEAFDAALLCSQLDALARGKSVQLPSYDFAQHRRSAMQRHARARPCILLEGIMVLAIRELRERCQLRIFVEAPESLRLARRVARDVRERGRLADAVREQFVQHVAPMHERWVAPSARHADLLLDGREPVGVSLTRIRAAFERASSLP